MATELVPAIRKALTAPSELASEIAGARTLQSISTRLISEVTQESLFAQILDAAAELMGADAASIQMLDADQESLTLLGWKNFHPDSAAYWQRIPAGSSSTCGVALRDGVRITVSDVEACGFMAGTRHLDEYRRSRIRACQSTPLRSRAGRPLGMISTHWSRPHTPTESDFRLFDVLARQAADLIERTRAEEALRESEERFRLIANTAPVFIWMADTEMRCTYVNQRWLDFTGLEPDDVLGRGWADGPDPKDAARWREACASALRRQPFRSEFRVRRHDGEYRWIVGKAVPRFHSDGSFAGYIGSAIDDTERRQAQQALATINQRLADAHETERARIARELHDDISQRLALLSIELATMSQTLPDAARRLEQTRDEVVRLSRDVHALSRRLHPAAIEHGRLVDAARALCREVGAQHGVEVAFSSESVPDRLPGRIAVCLYRVLQEALQNAIKHSGARGVQVVLHAEAHEVELLVRDLGSGFDLQAVHVHGLGLTSMKERLAAVQGALAIASAPRCGTTIKARVPFSRNETVS
jgi:PAS domain S-box-containing protein